jgi:hypothetical protein
VQFAPRLSSCYPSYGFDACPRESVPFDCSRESVPFAFLFSRLVLLMVCTRQSVPFVFVQGSLFPLTVLFQQACLAYGLFKGACSL